MVIPERHPYFLGYSDSHVKFVLSRSRAGGMGGTPWFSWVNFFAQIGFSFFVICVIKFFVFFFYVF